MKPRSYVGVLEQLLKPHGFERKGRNFVRNRDGFIDIVNLQVNQFAGSTVNVHTMDLTSEAMLLKAVGTVRPSGFPVNERLPNLVDGNDRWWHRDPNGPVEVAEMLRDYGLPFFEQLRPLDAQARRFGRLSDKWGATQLYLAMTLYRMGEKEEARRALDRRLPRWLQSWRPEVDALRQWLGCESAA